MRRKEDPKYPPTAETASKLKKSPHGSVGDFSVGGFTFYAKVAGRVFVQYLLRCTVEENYG